MKQQIIKRNTKGQVIDVKEYGKNKSNQLICSKCQTPVDFLLGEEEHAACERCYIEPATPQERTEAVMPVGDEDQVGQVRGTAPKSMTADELLGQLGVKKK